MHLRNHRLVIPGHVTINLRPFGDAQYGSKAFDINLWNEGVDEALSDPHTLTIGMGDITDNFRPTIRDRIEGAMIGDFEARQQMDEMHRDHVDKMIKILRLDKLFHAGYGCLGLLDGHHYYRYSDLTTSTQYICQKLKLPYLGEMSAFLRLLFNFKKGGKHGATRNLIIHAQHGEGGAQYVSTDTSKIERKTVPSFEADIYLRGHSTKKYGGGTDILYPTLSEPPRLAHKTIVWMNTGGFMRGYLENETTYVEKKMMAPARLGYGIVHIRIMKDETHNNRKIDLKVTT